MLVSGVFFLVSRLTQWQAEQSLVLLCDLGVLAGRATVRVCKTAKIGVPCFQTRVNDAYASFFASFRQIFVPSMINSCWSSRAGVPESPRVLFSGDWAPGLCQFIPAICGHTHPD